MEPELSSCLSSSRSLEFQRVLVITVCAVGDQRAQGKSHHEMLPLPPLCAAIFSPLSPASLSKSESALCSQFITPPALHSLVRNTDEGLLFYVQWYRTQVGPEKRYEQGEGGGMYPYDSWNHDFSWHTMKLTPCTGLGIKTQPVPSKLRVTNHPGFSEALLPLA